MNTTSKPKDSKTFHWGCHQCNILDVPSQSLKKALIKLKEHEKQSHKNKPTGYFGLKFL